MLSASESLCDSTPNSTIPHANLQDDGCDAVQARNARATYARQTGYGWRRDAELEERRREYWTQALPMYSETPNSIAISSSNKTAAHDSPLVARMRVSP